MDIKCALIYPNVDELHVSVSYFLMKGLNIFNTVRIWCFSDRASKHSLVSNYQLNA